jgi:hypothetical protein
MALAVGVAVGVFAWLAAVLAGRAGRRNLRRDTLVPICRRARGRADIARRPDDRRRRRRDVRLALAANNRITFYT